MIQHTVERMYAETDENRFLEVTYANGDKEVLYFRDFNSGAMIQNIVDRAKKAAIKSVLETSQPGLRGSGRDRGQTRTTAAADVGPVKLDLVEILVQFDHEPTDACICHQQVRPRPDDPYTVPLGIGPRHQLLQLADRFCAREQLSWSTGSDRRQPGERIVTLHSRRGMGHA